MQLFMLNYYKKYIDCEIEKIVRVDYAGECGAVDIYKSQQEYFINRNEINDADDLQLTIEEEVVHKNFFENLIKKEKYRPTFFSPLWELFGKFVGKKTAKFGIKYVDLTTIGVEAVIVEHYQGQIIKLNHLRNLVHDVLNDSEKEPYLMKIDSLCENINKFYNEELDHKINSELKVGNIGKIDLFFQHIIGFGTKVVINIAKNF